MSYRNKLIQYENDLKQNQMLDDFDVTAYKQLNLDLQHMTDKEATKHYKNHGFYEGRKYRNGIIPSDFDVIIYKQLNYDLQHMSDEEAIKHYEKHGSYECRKYKKSCIPYDFDEIIYKQLNYDLQHMSHKEAMNHYKNYGFYEKRKYKSQIYNNIENINILNDFLQKYNVSESDMRTNAKIEFRYECFKNMPFMKNIILPEIPQNSYYEAVLIEYRCFPHLEFLIRNTINKLGYKWSHTIVCGTINYDYMIDMCNKISPQIKIIKTEFENLDQNTYSKMLSSRYFWDFFVGEKILIYQEDSIIFKNNIDDFLHWDYIGAPWPENQDDNKGGVGNGGISLRTKSVMKKIIETISVENTIYNSSTTNYVLANKLTIFPEDVYFTKNMEDFNLGLLADRTSASYFSTECILNNYSFAGHNFWICDYDWKQRIYDNVIIQFKLNYKKYINALNVMQNINENTLYNFISSNKRLVGIYSPYEFSLGGGENYLSKIMNYFINKDYFVVFFNYTKFHKTRRLLNYYLNYNSQYVLNVSDQFIIDKKFRDKIYGELDYFIFMNNISLPNIKGIGKKNIYHTQFPFDYNTSYNFIPSLIEDKTVNSYDNIIVNSEFTHKYLLDMYNKYNIEYNTNNIKVVYPVCIDTVNTYKYEKQNYSFVMIGRIFEYSTDANNKHFDKMIKILSDFTDYNYELNIIGSVKSEKWYNYLMQLIGDNNKIKIHSDISEDEKNNIIQKSKYIVQLTGFEENKISNEEHFGISIIEGINYNCIPISYNGGYPPYYIKNNENGYIINDSEELKILVYNILNNNEIVDYNNFNNNNFNNNEFNLNKFTYDSFMKSLDEII
jgi:hypothetical protein